MSSLDDILRLDFKSKIAGEAPLASPIRPTASGLCCLTAPSNAAGLAYRVHGSTVLERISVSDEDLSVEKVYNISQPVVHIACSHDGRLVAVACIDGSLQCFDSTASSVTLRWTIPNAHSHVVTNISTSPSSDRSYAAGASGPVGSLAFSPEGYELVLVDQAKGLGIYNAATSAPIDTVAQSVSDAMSAAWITNQSRSGNLLAVGKKDGTLEIYNYQDSKLETVSQLGCPTEEDGFSCTHIESFEDTLVAGLCRVIPSDDEPDEDDEDDTAEHEASMYVTSIDSASNTNTEWSEHGDVVPFFTVPKSGRHTFFTSSFKVGKTLVVVAANVGSDVAVLAQDGSEWNVVEFQEGAAATTPTDDEDEFTYPLGISVVKNASGTHQLLLAATDGSLSTFSFENESDPNCFAASAITGATTLPSAPVETIESVGPPELTNEPSVQEEATVGEHSSQASGFSFKSSTFSLAPVSAPSPFGAPTQKSEGFSFGASSQSGGVSGETTGPSGSSQSTSAFGSSSTAIAFGSGSASGLSFGKGSSYSFGSPGNSTFGLTSPLGGGKGLGGNPSNSTASKAPLFGSVNSSVFGQGTTAGVGFGALSKSDKGSGIFSSNPKFNAFEKPSPLSVGNVPSSMVKPLFGGTPSAETKNEQNEKASVKSENKVPSFGTGSKAPAFGITATPASGGFSTAASSPSPFNAFSRPAKSAAHAMAKPLFPSKSSEATKSTDIENEKKEDSIVKTEAPRSNNTPVPSGEKEPMSKPGKTAARVFDEFDEGKTGTLPVSSFESMLDELGEGFHGDEFDKQIALIDPSKSGNITRISFIDWYTTLVEGGDEDTDNDSLDSEDRAERAEEEGKAKKAFAELSKTTNGISTIALSDFPKVIEALGTTYCEEEHRKTLKKLKKPGDRIYKEDFLAWYIDWLFGEDESSDEEDEDDDEGREDDHEKGVASEQEGLSSLFKVDENSWKCEVCSVRNKGDTNKCAACETPRPNWTGNVEESKGSSKETSEAGSGSSIGQSGFTFGGAATGGSIGSGGFTFGTTGSKDAKADKGSTGGFSFGGTSGGTGFKFEASAPLAGGISFGTSKGDSKSEKESGGVSSRSSNGGAGDSVVGSKGAASVTSSYPPLSSKAPTPFGSSQTKLKESTKVSSSYPPISAKAPTPFSAPQTKSSSSTAYPPLSSKAPTPFGASSASRKGSKESASSYPPLSIKAPKPFSSTQSKTPASSGYPPMSSQAPTPFSANTQPKAEAKAPTSSAYPPMATKPPTPFGSLSKPAAKAPGASSYPPISSKAPTPFSSVSQKKATSGAPLSSSYPPMSATAPNPFKASAMAKSKPKSNPPSYPPLSTKAPSPFSPSQPKPSASSGFPTQSAKTSQLSSKAKVSTKGQVPPGGYPPMATQAPTPFATSKVVTKPPLASSYPPISSSAPTPFVSSRPSAAAVGSTSRSLVPSHQTLVTSQQRIKADIDPVKGSKAGAKFAALVEKMNHTIERVFEVRQAIEAEPEDLRSIIQTMVEQIQQLRVALLDIDTLLVEQKQKNAFLMSRKTDASRQIHEARRLVETNLLPNDNRAENLDEAPPLDYESEQCRRKFAATAAFVRGQMKLLSDRVKLLQSASNSSGNRALLLDIMALFEKTKFFKETTKRIEGKVSEASKVAPLKQSQSNGQRIGCTTYSLNNSPKPSKSKRTKLRPLPLPEAFSPAFVKKESGAKANDLGVVGKWNAIELALQSFGSKHTSTVKLCGLSSPRFNTNSSQKKQGTRRNLGASLLLSPAEKTSYAAPALSPSKSVSIFSPRSSVKPRPGWDQASNIDQNRVKQISLSLPQDLKEVTISAASRPTLAALGTTPEKVQASLDLKKGDGIARPPQRQQKGTDGFQLKKVTEAKKPSKAAFPPLPTKAPTPFSQQKTEKGKSDSRPKVGASSGYPPMSAAAPKPFSTQGSKADAKKTSAKKVEPAKPESKPIVFSSSAEKTTPKNDGASPFGGMKGLGDSLFSLGGKTNSKGSNTTPFAPSKPASEMALGGGSEPDYKSILGTFYQKHNPSKLSEVDKHLERYKGREKEMFQKLAQKYKVPSPLDAPQSNGQEGSTTPAAPAGFGGSVAPASSPFSSDSNVMKTSTSFAALNSAAAPSPSPFGNVAGPALGAQSSPFGKPANAPSTPFGATASGGLSSASPFGNSNIAQPSPFGGAPTAPAPQAASQTFNGRTAREMLISFYQQKNPSKVAEVDKLLMKYRGNEEHMFRNLAKKYQLDPSVFGISGVPQPPAGGFGSSQTAAPAFGQQSTLGGGASPFGQSTGFSTSQKPATPFGGGPPTAGSSGGHTFGTGTGAAFGSSSFGSLANSTNPSPFGAASSGGFGSSGSGFGAPVGGFASPTPFGAPRR